MYFHSIGQLCPGKRIMSVSRFNKTKTIHFFIIWNSTLRSIIQGIQLLYAPVTSYFPIQENKISQQHCLSSWALVQIVVSFVLLNNSFMLLHYDLVCFTFYSVCVLAPFAERLCIQPHCWLWNCSHDEREAVLCGVCFEL